MASLVWIVTGIILFGAMAAGAIRLWINKKRQDIQTDPFGNPKMPPED